MTIRHAIWRKPAIAVAGGVLVILGIILLPLPGPGLLVIAAGVAVWAREFGWAKRWLQRLRQQLERLKPPKRPE